MRRITVLVAGVAAMSLLAGCQGGMPKDHAERIKNLTKAAGATEYESMDVTDQGADVVGFKDGKKIRQSYVDGEIDAIDYGPADLASEVSAPESSFPLAKLDEYATKAKAECGGTKYWVGLVASGTDTPLLRWGCQFQQARHTMYKDQEITSPTSWDEATLKQDLAYAKEIGGSDVVRLNLTGTSGPTGKMSFAWTTLEDVNGTSFARSGMLSKNDLGALVVVQDRAGSEKAPFDPSSIDVAAMRKGMVEIATKFNVQPEALAVYAVTKEDDGTLVLLGGDGLKGYTAVVG